LRGANGVVVILIALWFAMMPGHAQTAPDPSKARFDHLEWGEEVYTPAQRLRFLRPLIRNADAREQFYTEACAIFDAEKPQPAARTAFDAFRAKWAASEPDAVAALGQQFSQIVDYLYADLVIRHWWYNPQPLNDIQQAENLPYIAYMRNHPNVRVEAFSRLSVPGAAYQAPLLMSIAARNSPEIIGLFIHMVRTYSDQQLIRPLDEYVGYDTNRDGLVSNDEATWEPWKSIPDKIKLTCMKDGHVYAVPTDMTPGPIVLVYRRDLFQEAGLDPNKPPRTWDEFLDISRRLTRPQMKIQGARFQMGRRGFFLYNGAWLWYPWFWSAGGDLVKQHRACPECGTRGTWLKEETAFICEQCGKPVIHDKQGQPLESEWEATFADEGGAAAIELYQKLRWQLWSRCPDDDEPIVFDRKAIAGKLANADTNAVICTAMCAKCGKEVSCRKPDIIEGMARIYSPTENVDRNEAFENGEVSMMIYYLAPSELGNLNLRPDQIGVAPVPVRTPNDKPWTVSQPGFLALASEFDSQAKQDVAWDLVSARYAHLKDMARAQASAGYYKFMAPAQLKAAGLDEFLEELPDWWIDNLNTAFKYTRTEPFQKNASYIQDQVLPTNVFDRIFNDPNLDALELMKTAQDEANTKFLSSESSEQVRRYRPLAWVVVIVAGVVFVTLFIVYIRMAAKHYKVQGSSGMSEKVRLIAPLALLAPAVISIGLWSYYPLIRGSLMAFQDYRILGGSRWIGIDNFVQVIIDNTFREALWNTFRYVFYALALGFLAPIILAILLSEVPIGKYFFRTVFYLPAVMSSLVVMFLWKLMYNETDYGFLNKIVMNGTLMMIIKVVLIGVGVAVAGFAIRLGERAVRLSHRTLRQWWPALATAALAVLGIAGVIWSPLFQGRSGPLAASELFWILCGLFGFGLTLSCVLELLGADRERMTGPLVAGMFAALTLHLGIVWTRASQPIGWLSSEFYAMPAVIIPFVWAGAGPGCLIYLAALKSVPEDLYEAADVDGAGMWPKLWHITIPTLKPLIIINFVGATIGAFQSMQNILVMTGGAAKTMVLGLQIWTEAYIYLNFGYATAIAWILGSMLIGFTVMQLNILRKVEFRKAGEN